MTLWCWLGMKRAAGHEWLINGKWKMLWSGNERGKIMINHNNRRMWNISTRTITSDEICTREMKSRIAMAKGAFNKQTLFTKKLELHLRRKLEKYYIWSKHLPSKTLLFTMNNFNIDHEFYCHLPWTKLMLTMDNIVIYHEQNWHCPWTTL